MPSDREVAQLSNDAVGVARLIPIRNNKKQCCGSEFAKWHDSYTPEECAGKWRQNNADLKLLCHEWFHHVRHHVHYGLCTGEFATVIWRLNISTASFRGDVRGESGLRKFASVNRRTPQWARGRFTRTTMPAWLEKWRFVKFWYMC